jgi:hypothetical protein
MEKAPNHYSIIEVQSCEVSLAQQWLWIFYLVFWVAMVTTHLIFS